MKKPVTCDIFCTVVDNYGDVGVSWRLARQLAAENDVVVRLWVDDLESFRRLCPEVDTSQEQQYCRGIDIRQWCELFPAVETANLVIEAFACKLPERYLAEMAARNRKPVWINLEYLSAEDWVEGCHKLPSPHPSLPLVKYFFFPGFTPKTGGLLLERNLLARRDTFLNDAEQQRAFWQAVGLPPPAADMLKVSLFCYENDALRELFDAWAQGTQKVLCLAPEGRILPQIEQYFDVSNQDSPDGDCMEIKSKLRNYSRGNLLVHVMPFVEQERYDELLWVCDVNFVRGEDSCVRAQWAGKPFIWHIYPQHDGVQLQKLRAFMKLYCVGVPPESTQSLHELWEAWNELPRAKLAHSADSSQSTSTDLGQSWSNFWRHEPILRQHAIDWARKLSANNLALNLLDFFSSIDRMLDSKNF